MDKVKTLLQRLTDRDWTEAVLHHTAGIPATVLLKDMKFEIQDDYLIINSDQTVLPMSRVEQRGLLNQITPQNIERGLNVEAVQKAAEEALKPSYCEYRIDLNHVAMYEFHKKKTIATPSMIVQP